MKIIRVLIPASLVLGTVFSQTPTARLEFEAVSVKPAESLVAGRAATGGLKMDGAQAHLLHFALKNLITMAYNVRGYQVIGPDWLDSQRFDIDAKLPAGADRTQVAEMLQSLLADRFHIKFHIASKEFPVYALVVAAGGATLKDLTEAGETTDAKDPVEASGYGGPQGGGGNYGNGSSYSLADNRFECKKLTTARIANVLSSFLDRPVVDITGLKGKYDISVNLAADDYRGMLFRSAVNAGVAFPAETLRFLDGVDNASLYEGLRAVGLKLEPRKAPLQVMAIDSILKSPTEN